MTRRSPAASNTACGRRWAFSVSLAIALVAGFSAEAWAQTPARWKAHDMTRPRPPKVTSSLQLPVAPPSDAIVLFDGSDVSKWRSRDGSPSKWIVKDGYMESVAGAGYVFTRDGFGDVQLHVEWAAPTPAEGKGQGRGNSGVFLMGLYEIQVLDSWDNITYADGQASAVYGQHVPLANASRPPGEWQSYDIFFRRPRFRPDGSLEKAARVTVLHNGILVQDNVEIWGGTSWLQHHPYESHPDRMPIALQDHGNPVRYRNIWLRELDESPSPAPTATDPRPLITMAPEVLDRYVGKYQIGRRGPGFQIRRDGARLFAQVLGVGNLEMLTHSPEEFSLRWTASRVVFDLNEEGRPTGLTFHIGGDEMRAKKVE